MAGEGALTVTFEAVLPGKFGQCRFDFADRLALALQGDGGEQEVFRFHRFMSQNTGADVRIVVARAQRNARPPGRSQSAMRVQSLPRQPIGRAAKPPASRSLAQM